MATAVLLIETSSDFAFYTQRARLDDRDYVLHFSWNEREGRWYLGIHDIEDDPIVDSIKLVTNWPLLRYYHSDPRCPPGELMVQTLTSDDSPPGFDELGSDKRCQLNYYAQNTEV